GSVPAMNSSVTFFVVNGPGFIPLNASTDSSTMPFGRLKPTIGVPALTSVRIRDQSGADDFRDRVSLSGSLLLLPIQIPTTRAGAFGSLGGARYPYAWTSRFSFVVPVL